MKQYQALTPHGRRKYGVHVGAWVITIILAAVFGPPWLWALVIVLAMTQVVSLLKTIGTQEAQVAEVRGALADQRLQFEQERAAKEKQDALEAKREASRRHLEEQRRLALVTGRPKLR